MGFTKTLRLFITYTNKVPCKLHFEAIFLFIELIFMRDLQLNCINTAR